MLCVSYFIFLNNYYFLYRIYNTGHLDLRTELDEIFKEWCLPDVEYKLNVCHSEKCKQWWMKINLRKTAKIRRLKVFDL
jgi:hypothetical protein